MGFPHRVQVIINQTITSHQSPHMHSLAMLMHGQYKQYTRAGGKCADINITSYGMNGLRRLSVIINNGAACKLCHMVQENGMQRHSFTSLTPHTHTHTHTFIYTHTHRQLGREGRERERRKKGEVAFLTSEPCPCAGQSTKLISSIRELCKPGGPLYGFSRDRQTKDPTLGSYRIQSPSQTTNSLLGLICTHHIATAV